MYQAVYNSPVGELTLASDGTNLTGLWLKGQKYFTCTLTEEWEKQNNLAIFLQVKEWLDRYFSGKRPSIAEIPLAPSGGEFRHTVWKILCEIPYGEVTTYGAIGKEVAKLTGKKTMSAQAVGGAVAHNPVSIIIPCHRVVGTNGSLTGYAGGIDKKIRLLELEGVDLSGYFVPAKGTAL